MSVDSSNYLSKVLRLNRFIKKLAHGEKYSNRGILLDNQKAIYFPIPKVANTSLRVACLDLMDIKIPEDWSPGAYVYRGADFQYLNQEDIHKYPSFWKFSFVRNPWDRVVSCYLNKIKMNEEDFNKVTYANGIHESLIRYGMFRAKMPFSEFVSALSKIPDRNSDGHFRSQYTFLTNSRGRPIADFVGRFENLADDFECVSKKLGKPDISLVHIQKSNNSDYRGFYTPYTKDLVFNRYRNDVESYEYSF